MIRNNRGQWALIELLVVVVIIGILAYVFLPRYLSGGGSGGVNNGGAATPKQRAQGVQCMSNLQQARSAIEMYQQSNEEFPKSVDELSSAGVSGELKKCPVSGTPYNYDPASGRIWCTTPGHGRY